MKQKDKKKKKKKRQKKSKEQLKKQNRLTNLSFALNSPSKSTMVWVLGVKFLPKLDASLNAWENVMCACVYMDLYLALPYFQPSFSMASFTEHNPMVILCLVQRTSFILLADSSLSTFSVEYVTSTWLDWKRLHSFLKGYSCVNLTHGLTHHETVLDSLSRDKVCRPLANVVLASSETTARQKYIAVNGSKYKTAIKKPRVQ